MVTIEFNPFLEQYDAQILDHFLSHSTVFLRNF